MIVDVYVDGSFNEKLQTYGGGIVILVDVLDEPLIQQVVGNDPVLIPYRNIAGELGAVITAMNTIDNFTDVEKVRIHHDYVGIAYWITNQWQAKKALSSEYKRFMREFQKKFNIEFIHVKGHSGDKYNNMADKLAREATFMEVSKGDT